MMMTILMCDYVGKVPRQTNPLHSKEQASHNDSFSAQHFFPVAVSSVVAARVTWDLVTPLPPSPSQRVTGYLFHHCRYGCR